MKTKFILSAVIVIGVTTLTGCEPTQPKTFVRSETQTLKLIRFDPPKHTYAQFQFEDGTPSDNIWVAKHCSNYRNKAVVGRTYKATVNYVKVVDKDGSERLRRYLVASNIRGLLC